MMERSKLALLFFSIFTICVLELLAIMKGIDGRSLAIAMAVIALLSPSPVFQFRFGQYQVKKGEDKDAISKEGH